MAPSTDSTLLLVILAFIALVGLAGLALLGSLVRLVLRLEAQLTTGLDEVRTELVATAQQVRTTSRQVGAVLDQVSRGARYASMAVELWRLWRHRTPAAAPAAVRRTLWTRVGLPLGVMAVKALAARRSAGPGGPPAPSA